MLIAAGVLAALAAIAFAIFKFKSKATDDLPTTGEITVSDV